MQAVGRGPEPVETDKRQIASIYPRPGRKLRLTRLVDDGNRAEPVCDVFEARDHAVILQHQRFCAPIAPDRAGEALR